MEITFVWSKTSRIFHTPLPRKGFVIILIVERFWQPAAAVHTISAYNNFSNSCLQHPKGEKAWVFSYYIVSCNIIELRSFSLTSTKHAPKATATTVKEKTEETITNRVGKSVFDGLNLLHGIPTSSYLTHNNSSCRLFYIELFKRPRNCSWALICFGVLHQMLCPAVWNQSMFKWKDFFLLTCVHLMLRNVLLAFYGFLVFFVVVLNFFLFLIF